MRVQLAQQAKEILGQSDLVIITERVDDVALLIGQMVKMGLPEVLDRHIPHHWTQRGLSWGWTAVVWLAYILTEGDHRKVLCFAIILCQLCRNSLPPCPRDSGEFPCSTNKFSFTVCRNTLPKVQIATYALPKNLSHFFWAQSSGICLFLPFSWSLLYGEAARLCDNRSSHRLFGYFSPFFRLF